VTDQRALLLSDATMPVNFCKAGANCALAMLEHFGSRIFMVADVHEELARHGESSPAVKKLIDRWPTTQVLGLDLDLTTNVASILKLTRLTGDHPKADAGEVATVLFAAKCRDEGMREYVVVTDDRFGIDVARDRKLPLQNSPQVIVEMVCADSLSFADGDRVWRHCFTNRAKWSAYREAVARSCPNRVPH
jgi:hypothetical protein